MPEERSAGRKKCLKEVPEGKELPGKEGQLDVKRSPMEQIGLNGRGSLFFFLYDIKEKKVMGKAFLRSLWVKRGFKFQRRRSFVLSLKFTIWRQQMTWFKKNKAK